MAGLVAGVSVGVTIRECKAGNVRIPWRICKSQRQFFVAVSEEEPFISHAEALVDALLDSNPEKQCFRALVELARAATLLYCQHEVPDGFAHDIRSRLVKLLHAYRYVLPSFSAQER